MKSKMLLTVVMLASCIASSINCAGKISPPSPVLGVDIVSIKKGENAPFSGTLFSPFYLKNYLEWKEGLE